MSGLFSNDAMYNMDKAEKEINDTRLLIDLKVETQVLLQLLVSKGIVTREEVQSMRETVKRQPQYKAVYDYLDQSKKTAEYYQQNPEQHLKDIMNAKLNGKL